MEVNELLVAGIISLTGAVVALWRAFKKKLDDCEVDRECLWMALAEISGEKMEVLRRRFNGKGE